MSRSRAYQPQSPLPLVIMAGRDAQGQPLPEGCAAHWLAGYKAVEWLVDGEPLITTLVRRARATGHFDPIYVAGPAERLRPLALDAILIDTDGELDTNIAAALAALGEQLKGSVAFLASDILPSVTSLNAAMALYAASRRSAIFFPLVRVPEQQESLGQSAYKPRYRLVEPGGQESAVLPGHLLIVRPTAIRLNLLYALVRLGYRTRNQPVRQRTWRMLLGAIGFLLREDLRLLLAGKAPHLTLTVVRNALIVSRSLQQGRIGTHALARRLRAVLMRASYRLGHPRTAVVLPITGLLDLAKDFDTVEEIEAAGGTRAGAPSGTPADDDQSRR